MPPLPYSLNEVGGLFCTLFTSGQRYLDQLSPGIDKNHKKNGQQQESDIEDVCFTLFFVVTDEAHMLHAAIVVQPGVSGRQWGGRWEVRSRHQ